MIYLSFPSISPVFFSIGPLDIRWYSLAYIVGFIFAWRYIKYLASNKAVSHSNSINEKLIDDLIFYSIIGLIIGARLGYVIFYNYDYYSENLIEILYLWQGGLSFHGGLIGVLFSFYLFGRKFNLKFSDVMEHYAICFPIGLGSVRVGNFLGGELLGRPTEVSWGVIFSNDPEGLLRHPSQLYQAFSEGFILFILLYLFARTNPPRWSIAGLFLSGYAVVRIFTENFRTPDAHIGFDLLEIFTRGQLLSLPMLIIGISLMIFAYRKKPS